MRLLVLFSTICFLVCGCVTRDEEVLTPEIVAERKALGEKIGKRVEAASAIELLSLDPLGGYPELKRPTAIGTLDRYNVVGTAKIATAREIGSIAHAIAAAVSGGKFSAGCFLPHHAIRFHDSDGETTILLCFHCANGEIQVNGKRDLVFVIDANLEPGFDALLAKYNLPRAYFPSPAELLEIQARRKPADASRQ